MKIEKMPLDKYNEILTTMKHKVEINKKEEFLSQDEILEISKDTEVKLFNDITFNTKKYESLNNIKTSYYITIDKECSITKFKNIKCRNLNLTELKNKDLILDQIDCNHLESYDMNSILIKNSSLYLIDLVRIKSLSILNSEIRTLHGLMTNINIINKKTDITYLNCSGDYIIEADENHNTNIYEKGSLNFIMKKYKVI